MRDALWRTRLILQTMDAQLAESLYDFVTRLSTNPELEAQICHSLTGLQPRYELHSFAHRIARLPGHSSQELSPKKVSPKCPV